MKPTTINRDRHTVPTFAEYLQQIGHASTHIALRARAQYSKFIADLNRKQYADIIAEALTDYNATATTARASHNTKRSKAETRRAEAEKLYRLADKLTTSAEDALEYLAEADRLSIEADHLTESATADREYAEDTEREHQSCTFSDREDVVHESIIAYLEYMNGKDWSDPDTRASAFITAIKTAGAYAHKLAGSAGATHNSTKVISMTEDEQRTANANGENITEQEAERRASATRADIIRKYGSIDERIPFSTSGAMLDGWTTYEKRNTKRHQGWYKVTHYKRIAPQPINTEALNVAIRTDLFESYDLQELVTIAKFTERESCVLCLMAEVTAEENGIFPSDEAQTVAEAGQEAVNKYRTECDQRKRACTVQKSRDNIEREFKRRADQKRKTAELEKAFEMCGTSASAIDMAVSRFRAKLEKAVLETHRRNTERVYRGATPRPEAIPSVTVYSNQTAPVTIYSTVSPVFIESDQKPASDHAQREKERIQRIVNRYTITPSRTTAEEYRALWNMWDTLTQYRADLPKDERRAETLRRKAEEASQTASRARATADSYSKRDHSTEARTARIEAERAEDEARRLEARAKDYAQDVQRMRDFISRHSK